MEQEDNTLVCKGYTINVIKAITDPIRYATEDLHDEDRVPPDEDSFELEPITIRFSVDASLK